MSKHCAIGVNRHHMLDTSSTAALNDVIVHLLVERDTGVGSKRAEFGVVTTGVGPRCCHFNRSCRFRESLPAPFSTFSSALFFTIDDLRNALKFWRFITKDGVCHSLKKSNQGPTEFVIFCVS